MSTSTAASPDQAPDQASTEALHSLRRSDAAEPGILRRRRGRGFSYEWADGSRVDEPEVLERITGLVLPPAWKDVWICPWPDGHIQAIGTDAAGRKQYRYHDQWRIERDREKHEHVLELGRRLPEMRRRVDGLLEASHELGRERVLACALRLLDLGFFRIGSEEYAEENETFGLATMRKEHVKIQGSAVVFDYSAKHSLARHQSVVDEDVLDVVGRLKRRRGGGAELLAWKDRKGWHDVKSGDVNEFIRELSGGDFSAKNFRTWHATVLMAVALAVSFEAPDSESARKRVVARAYREVSTYLGNTPAVCRASYVDPRVVELYHRGVTIAPALDLLGADQEFGQMATLGPIEQAVLDLLTT